MFLLEKVSDLFGHWWGVTAFVLGAAVAWQLKTRNLVFKVNSWACWSLKSSFEILAIHLDVNDLWIKTFYFCGWYMSDLLDSLL